MTDKIEDQNEEKKVETPKDDQEQHNEGVPKLTPLEEQAAGFGWKPKEKWVEEGGTEEDWVPAKHFLKFGELKKQVIEKDRELNKSQKIIKMMKDHHLNVRDAAYKQAMDDLKSKRNAALENNDLIEAERIRDRIDETKENFQKAGTLPANVEKEIKEVVEQQGTTPPPEYFDFLERNPWYVADQAHQDEISIEADKIGYAEVQNARARNIEVTPGQVFKAVENKIRKLYPEKFKTPASPQTASSKQSDKSTGKTAKLSDEELAVAKAFGMTPEKYAEQQKTYRGRS